MTEAPEREEWRPVIGFPDYEVSDHGRVRSLDHVRTYTRTRNGKTVQIARRHKGRILAAGTMKSGHRNVTLGRDHTRLVHHLVLEAFVGPRPPGLESLHGDGVPGHNRPDNLRWGTRSENVLDAIRHGTFRNSPHQGSAHPNAKLTEDAVRQIRQRAGEKPYGQLGADYGVSGSVIGNIIRGRTWTHVD